MQMLLIILAGLCAGSFVGATVWRIKHKKNWLTGRSQCEKCGHTLAPSDLIPVASWLALSGRCRYCHKQICVETLLLEVVTALLFWGMYMLWPYPLVGSGWLVFAVWLIGVTIGTILILYDYQYMLLPNVLVFPLYSLSIVFATALYYSSLTRLFMALLSGAFLYGFFYALWRISQGKWIGGGDVKLALALGTFAQTPTKALLVLFVASLFGTIYGLPLVINNKGKAKVSHRIPFGPFLIVGTWVAVLAGDRLLLWYGALLT